MDIIDARSGELANDAESVQLLVDRDADATRFLRNDNQWAHPCRCGLLDDACCEELV